MHSLAFSSRNTAFLCSQRECIHSCMFQKLCSWRNLQRSLMMTFRIYYYYTKSTPPKRRVSWGVLNKVMGENLITERHFAVSAASRATPAIGVARERRVWRAIPWISPSIRSVHSTWPDDQIICPTEGLKNAQWTEGMIAFLVQILSSGKSCFGICCKCHSADY